VDVGFIRQMSRSSPGASLPLAGVQEKAHLWPHLLALPLLGSNPLAGLERGCRSFPPLAGETLVVVNSCFCRNDGGSGGGGEGIL